MRKHPQPSEILVTQSNGARELVAMIRGHLILPDDKTTVLIVDESALRALGKDPNFSTFESRRQRLLGLVEEALQPLVDQLRQL